MQQELREETPYMRSPDRPPGSGHGGSERQALLMVLQSTAASPEPAPAMLRDEEPYPLDG
jgi:hypothetical protein